MATYRFLCKSRRRVEGLVTDRDGASVGSEARDGAFAAFLKEQCLGLWRRDKHARDIFAGERWGATRARHALPFMISRFCTTPLRATAAPHRLPARLPTGKPT